MQTKVLIRGHMQQEFDGRQLRVNLAGDKPPPRNTSSY